jgi:hypothetical protein
VEEEEKFPFRTRSVDRNFPRKKVLEVALDPPPPAVPACTRPFPFLEASARTHSCCAYGMQSYGKKGSDTCNESPGGERPCACGVRVVSVGPGRGGEGGGAREFSRRSSYEPRKKDTKPHDTLHSLSGLGRAIVRNRSDGYRFSSQERHCVFQFIRRLFSVLTF